jgi:LAO/AO transport system kinase
LKNDNLKNWADKIISGDRVALSRAITLAESKRSEHREEAALLLELIMDSTGKSKRIAITGAPGAGKSTLIEAYGLFLIEKGNKVAVLAIDPSSKINKGSILGDKTRMESLSMHPNAYIRPSAAGETLGGVASATREAILFCEAAGYDHILIETVGVGQSEIAAAYLSDFFILVLIPGAGDDLQGIKRGIVEMADLIVVNKSDEERKSLAMIAKGHYQQALHLLPPKRKGQTVDVILCSALEKKGLEELHKGIEIVFSQMENGAISSLKEIRVSQDKFWFQESLNFELKTLLESEPNYGTLLKDALQNIEIKKSSPFREAKILISKIFNGFYQ